MSFARYRGSYLRLIYEKVDPSGEVNIPMTFTAPNCFAAS
jgi:hypothetical protein